MKTGWYMYMYIHGRHACMIPMVEINEKLFELNLTCLLRYLRRLITNLIWEAGVPIIFAQGREGPVIRVTATSGIRHHG